MNLKNQIVAVLIVSGSGTAAAPLEADAIFSSGWTRAHAQTLADGASTLIRRAGYRCDSVSSIQKWVFSSGFDVVCNGFRYSYEIEDRGGNWVVSLE
jgi:hypothetical protein